MDVQALNELLECSVCLEQLDDTSKVLPCQHTFCKRCLFEIVSTKHELRCPECRTLVNIPVDDLPTNILLVRLLEGLKTQSRGLPSGKQVSPKRAKKEISPHAASAGLLPRQQQNGQNSGRDRPCAKAMFNYDGKEPSDLSFKKGDIVYLRRQIDENWYDGELNGKFGFFPVNYVQILTPLPATIPQCKALYDFDMKDENEDDCLTFKKEEVLTIIKQVDENWLEGKKGDKIGIFPISFVEVNEPGKILLRLTNSQSNKNHDKDPPKTPAHPKSVKKEEQNKTIPTSVSDGHTSLSTDKTSQKRHSLPTLHQDLLMGINMTARQSPEIPSTSREVPDKVEVQSTTSGVIPVRPEPQKHSPSLYIAMYNYKPQRQDEVELRKGDVYCVMEKCQDGWFKGQNVKDGVNGVFPGNYVQSMRSHQNAGKSSDASKLPSVKPKAPPPKTNSQEQVPARPPSVTKPKSSPSRNVSLETSKSGGSLELPNTTEKGDMGPAPLVPKHGKETSASHSSGSKSSSAIATPTPTPMSKSGSPILSTTKTTRYVRASKSLSPNTAAMAAAGKDPADVMSSSASGSLGGGSPVWKHALSATGQITPPNVALGAKGKTEHGPVPSMSSPLQLVNVDKDKKEKKEKEKLGLMKRLAAAGKSKKTKSIDTDTSSLSDSGVAHSRSSSYSSEVRQSSSNVGHKKSGSFDSTVQQTKPSRPKPLVREKYRCVETYPSQSELELDLKIGDIIYVHKKRDDGWFKGTLKRSGKTGLFPGSFVEPCVVEQPK